MDINEYYAEKRKITEKLFKQLVEKKFSGQPEVVDVTDEYGDVDIEKTKEATSLYIVSVRNRQANCTPGQVNLAVLHNAARGIADGTHTVATDEQIKAYYEKQAENKAAADKTEWNSAAKKEIVREVVREVPAAPVHAEKQAPVKR